MYLVIRKMVDAMVPNIFVINQNKMKISSQRSYNIDHEITDKSAEFIL